MAAHRTGKTYKGCCLMCGYHTVRGQGLAKRAPARDLRRFGGRTRRVKRTDLERT